MNAALVLNPLIVVRVVKMATIYLMTFVLLIVQQPSTKDM
jgi:hypothetical protein